MTHNFFIPKNSAPAQFHFGLSNELEENFHPILSLGMSSFTHIDPAKSGISILQVDKPKTPEAMKEIELFYDRFPPTLKLALEVTHPSWFESSSYNEALQKWLKRRGSSLVVNNAFGSRYFYHPQVQQKHLYLRFIGNGFIDRDKHRLEQWAERLSFQLYSGKDIYFMVKDEELSAGLIIDYFKSLLPAEFVLEFENNEQLSLF